MLQRLQAGVSVWCRGELVGMLDVQKIEQKLRGIYLSPAPRDAKWTWDRFRGEPGCAAWTRDRIEFIQRLGIADDAEWSSQVHHETDLILYSVRWYVLEFAVETLEKVFDWPEYEPV